MLSPDAYFCAVKIGTAVLITQLDVDVFAGLVEEASTYGECEAIEVNISGCGILDGHGAFVAACAHGVTSCYTEVEVQITDNVDVQVISQGDWNHGDIHCVGIVLVIAHEVGCIQRELMKEVTAVSAVQREGSTSTIQVWIVVFISECCNEVESVDRLPIICCQRTCLHGREYIGSGSRCPCERRHQSYC